MAKVTERDTKRVQDFGKQVAIHEVGDYGIIEYVNRDDKTLFHVCGTSTSCSSLDEALLLAIADKHMDINDAWRFSKFAMRMLKED